MEDWHRIVIKDLNKAFALLILFYKRTDLQLKPYCGMGLARLQIELRVNRLSFAAGKSLWLSVTDKLPVMCDEVNESEYIKKARNRTRTSMYSINC